MTDDFTESALAEAERRYIENDPDYPDRATAIARTAAFAVGAEWARDHLAAQEPTNVTDRLTHLSEPCPLTPDAITDEMVERARNVPSFDGRLSPTPRLVREMLTAALTEPTRPEGAEEIERLIETSPWHLAGSCSAEADWLAEHGVRVVGEEQP